MANRPGANFPLILSSNNATASAPPYSQFSFNFPGNINLTNRQICLQSLSTYYSWPNIVSSGPYAPNNVFAYQWVDGSVYTCTMPQGGYAVSDINAYLQYVMESNLHYTLDSNGNIIYYASWLTNSPLYAVQWTSSLVPLTAALAGGSYPAGNTWSTAYNVGAVTEGPQLQIAQAGFGAVVGFAVGDYPSAGLPTSNYSVVSTTTPELSPVSSVLVSTNVTSNFLSLQPSVLYSFAPAGVTYGGTIVVTPPELLWIDCIPGEHQTLTVSLLDQNFQPLGALDAATTMQVVIKNRDR